MRWTLGLGVVLIAAVAAGCAAAEPHPKADLRPVGLQLVRDLEPVLERYQRHYLNYFGCDRLYHYFGPWGDRNTDGSRRTVAMISRTPENERVIRPAVRLHSILGPALLARQTGWSPAIDEWLRGASLQFPWRAERLSPLWVPTPGDWGREYLDRAEAAANGHVSRLTGLLEVSAFVCESADIYDEFWGMWAHGEVLQVVREEAPVEAFQQAFSSLEPDARRAVARCLEVRRGRSRADAVTHYRVERAARDAAWAERVPFAASEEHQGRVRELAPGLRLWGGSKDKEAARQLQEMPESAVGAMLNELEFQASFLLPNRHSTAILLGAAFRKLPQAVREGVGGPDLDIVTCTRFELFQAIRRLAEYCRANEVLPLAERGSR